MSHNPLRDWRVRLGLSQADVARQVDVTPQTVYRWEAGTVNPQPRHFRALADVMGVGVGRLTLDWLRWHAAGRADVRFRRALGLCRR